MKSLFLRIFLWFWIAMALVAVVLVVGSPFFTRSRPGIERWQDDGEDWAKRRLDSAVSRLEEHGVEGVSLRHGRHGGRRGPSRILIFDSEGTEVLNQEAPRVARNLASKSLSSGAEERERSGSLYLIARPLTEVGGRRLVVVATLNRPPRLVDLLEPRALALRLALLAVIVGALSFWLARFLAGPVGALRLATRSLAVGDLTARVGGKVARRRDEIGELARDFDVMAERLEGVIGTQRRLLRDVSHELRSPLARLGVALELARGQAGDEAKNPLDRIEREAARLDQLIGQLLLLEKLEAGQPELEPFDFDLCEVLAEVVEDAAYEASAAGQEVCFQPCPFCLIQGFPDLIRSAIDNVLRNAIRYTCEGTAVEVGLRVADGHAEVVIKDQGPGVPVEDLDRLFEPFSRVADARDRESGGVGLGLAISDRAVRLHGGSVEARNHPDGGLEVLMKIPVERLDHGALRKG